MTIAVTTILPLDSTIACNCTAAQVILAESTLGSMGFG
jgi:hypothetical protein